MSNPNQNMNRMKKTYIAPNTTWAWFGLDKAYAEGIDVGAVTGSGGEIDDDGLVKRENPWEEETSGNSRGSLWEQKW